MSDKTCLIYAAWNRAPLLRRSLERLSELTVPDEIIVVDDGSVDETAQVAQDARDRLGLPVRYLYNHRPYEAMCCQAKNVGIKSTDADVLLFSEPEMYFRTDAVAQMLSVHSEDQEWGTKRLVNAGTVHHEQAPGLVCGCCGERFHQTKNWQAFWLALFRREWLVDVGGWDEHFPTSWGVDDVDAGTRLRIYGVGQYNALDVEVEHQWHPPRQNVQAPNWSYFESKNFNSNESLEHPNLVANGGHEWGVLVPRP